MRADVAELVLEINARGIDAVNRDLTRLDRNMENTGRSAGYMGSRIDGVRERVGRFGSVVSRLKTIMGAGALGAFVAMTNAADNFKDSIAEVSTLVDTSSFDLDKLSNAALDAGRAFGSAQAQPKAFYSIISAGASTAAEATETLTAANKLAIGGVADLEVAADGLTSVLNAYGDEVKSATSVSDTMFVGMKAGKTTISELSASVGTVAPLAKQAGVAFDELIASTAALTKGGVTTSVAMNGLKAIIASIIKPSSEAQKEATKLGLAFDAQALKSKGLVGFLADLKEKTQGNTETMAKLFGGVEALTPVLALTGASAKDLTAIMGQMAEKTGETEEAFRKMESSPAFQKKRLFGAITVEAIKFGETISNMLVPAMRFLADHMADFVAVGKTVAVLFAVKMALGVGAYVIGLAKAGIETTRYNIKLATMAGLSKRAAASQVLLGGATSKLSSAYSMIGGKLGLIGIAITALTVGYRANKDELVTLGETTASVGEWMAATWEWLKAMASQTADVIGYVFSDSFKQVEDPGPWDTLVGYFHELPKNAKIVTNATIGLFVGSIAAIQTVWGNLPAYFASLMLNVEIAVKRKVSALLEALIKPINAVRSLANLPPINIPIKIDIPTKALEIAKDDINSVGDAFKTAFDVDYVGAFGKVFNKGVAKPISKFIAKKPHDAFRKITKAEKEAAAVVKKLAGETKKLGNETENSTRSIKDHTKSTDKSTEAQKKTKTAVIELTDAQKEALRVRKSALESLQKLVEENENLSRELSGLPQKVDGLTDAENKNRNEILKSIEAKRKQIALNKKYDDAIDSQKEKIKQMSAELRLSSDALHDYNLKKEYGSKADIEAIKANDEIIEQLQRQKEMYGVMEGAVDSYVDKLLGGFKGVGNTVKNLKRALSDMLTGKGSAKGVGKAAVDMISPYKGNGAEAVIGNGANVFALGAQLGFDKWTQRLSTAGSMIGTALGGSVGGAIGAAIGTLVGAVRNWLRKKAKIRLDQSIVASQGEGVYDRDFASYETKGMTRETAFGSFGVSDKTSRYGRADESVKRAIQIMMDGMEEADALMAGILSDAEIARAKQSLANARVTTGNNSKDIEAFMDDRLTIQIRAMDGALQALIPSTATYTEKIQKLQEIQLAQKKFTPVLRQLGIMSDWSAGALTALSFGLADAAGGFQNFVGLMDNYRSKLFTGNEQTQQATFAITSKITNFQQEIGNTSIQSSADLRAYIESIKNSSQIATEAGRDNLINALNMVDAYVKLEAIQAQHIETLNTLRVAGLGANEGLIEIAGGLGALSSLVDNYTSTVYSAEEQSLIKQAEAANEIAKIADQLGIDPDALSTTEGLRNAVDNLSAGNRDLTEAQQEQLVSLLEATDSVRLLSEAGITVREAFDQLPDDLQNVVGGMNQVLTPLREANIELEEAADKIHLVASELNAISESRTNLGIQTQDNPRLMSRGLSVANDQLGYKDRDSNIPKDIYTNETARNNTNAQNQVRMDTNNTLIQSLNAQSDAERVILNDIRARNDALITRMQSLESINRQIVSAMHQQTAELEMQRELSS